MSGNIIDILIELLERRGNGAYFGEPVTQTGHMLQSAWLARREGAPDTLVAAALLHDVGHLMHDVGEDAADRGIDTRHEHVAADWLAEHFVPEVTEPIRLHVEAKRYLCHDRPGYYDALSPASRQSLELQGGPMDAAEAAAFRANPHAEAAVRLRIWDDAAKIRGLRTPDLDAFRASLQAGLRRR